MLRGVLSTINIVSIDIYVGIDLNLTGYTRHGFGDN